MWDLSSLTRNWTHTCIGNWSLNHWTSRGVPSFYCILSVLCIFWIAALIRCAFCKYFFLVCGLSSHSFFFKNHDQCFIYIDVGMCLKSMIIISMILLINNFFSHCDLTCYKFLLVLGWCPSEYGKFRLLEACLSSHIDCFSCCVLFLSVFCKHCPCVSFQSSLFFSL